MEKIKTILRDKFSRENVSAWLWHNRAALISFGITAVYLLIVMIVADVAPFGENAFTKVDSIHQYIPFMADYQDKLKHGGSLLYTWKVGGGMNFLSLLLYYMACPLNLILVFFSKRGTTAAFSILMAFKVAFSSGAFAYMLSRRKKKPENNMLMAAFGISFGLCNYIVGYSWNIMWMDCIMVLPLLILGYERMMKDKDFKLYVLSLFYVLYCNYYIAFILCIFLVLWFFSSGHESIKKFFMDGIRFALMSILAAGMAAFSLLTAFFAITKTASAKLSFPKFEFYGKFFDQWKKAIFLSRAVNADNFDGNINLYAGTIAIFGIFLFLVTDRISLIERIRKGLLMAILLLSFNTKLLNYIWHGFHDQFGIPNRFSICFTFTELYLAYLAVAKIKQTKFYRIIIAMLLTVGFYIACIILTKMNSKYSDLVVAMVSGLILLVYFTFLILRKNNVLSLYVSTMLLAGLITIEILASASLSIKENDVASAGYYQEYTEEMMEAVNTVDSYSKAKAYSFYRSDMSSHLMLDEPTYNGMNSLGTFCSTVRGDMVDLANNVGFYTGANEFLFNGGNILANDILGVRYVYSRTGEWYGGAEADKCVFENEAVKVYENQDVLPIAFGVDKNMISWGQKKSSATPGKKLNDLASLMTGIEDSVFTLNSEEYQVDSDRAKVYVDDNNPRTIHYSGAKNDTVIRVSFSARYGGRSYANIRGSGIKNVEYKVNEKNKASDRYQSQFFDMGYLEKNDIVEFDIKLGDSASSSGTIGLYISLCNEEVEREMVKKLSESKMNVTNVTDTKIEGSIELLESQLLFTSIPYDEGWHIYVDGKKIRTIKIATGLLGAEIEAGKHDIVMKYFPQGLVTGLLISVAAWAVFVIMYIGTKKKDGIYA